MGRLNQDVQQYCLGTVNTKTRTSNSIVEGSTPKLFTGGGDGKIKPGCPTVLSWNGQRQNCSLEMEMGSLNQDVQQYCVGTVNTKTVHWRWRWEYLTRTSNSIVLERSIPKLFTGGRDWKH